MTAFAAARWLAAALALPLIAGAQPAADAPSGAALEAALRGVWCSSNDGGATCWAYDEFHTGGVITACGQFPRATQPFTASARYTIEGRRACYEITGASESFGMSPGDRFCTEVVEVNERLQRYRAADGDEIFTQYRRPAGSRRCPGIEAGLTLPGARAVSGG